MFHKRDQERPRITIPCLYDEDGERVDITEAGQRLINQVRRGELDPNALPDAHPYVQDEVRVWLSQRKR
jgi:hypothetical protein